VHHCNGWTCVPYNPNDVFTLGELNAWTLYTSPYTVWSTKTTYSTANPPGNTVTVTPTSTTQVIQTQTKVATEVTTETAATITVTLVRPSSTTHAPGGGGPNSSPNSTVPIPAPSNIGAKVGAGFGVPLGIALIVALLFMFLRRRKRGDKPTVEMEGSVQPSSPRTVSELPQYTYSSIGAAGVVRKPVPKPTAMSVTESEESHSPPEQRPQGYGAQGYWPQSGQGQEMEARENRHEMMGVVHEMHELPGYHGA